MKKITWLSLLIPILSFGQWSQVSTTIEGENAGDRFGIDVEMNAAGDRVVAGGESNDGNGSNSGHARVFEYSGGVWTQIGSDIDGESSNDGSGYAVSINSIGNIIAVGAPSNDGAALNAGHVRVYQENSGVWTQLGSDIDGDISGHNAGYSVNLNSSGLILAVGIPDNGVNSIPGLVRVYEYSGGVWNQLGSDIQGENIGDRFGTAVSLNDAGNIIVVGARDNSDIDGVDANDWFGYSVDINGAGNIITAVAHLNSDAGTESGHVRVFENTGGTWTQIGSAITGEAAGDETTSVSINNAGNIVAVGAHWNGGSIGGASESGHARIFENIGGTWMQIGSDIDGEENDELGTSVSLNAIGERVALGGPYYTKPSLGSFTGGVKVFENLAVLSTSDSVLQGIGVFPNPSNEVAVISLGKVYDTIKLHVFDLTGKSISTSEHYQTDYIHLKTNDLQSGIYLLQIEADNGSSCLKLIKQ